MSDTSLYDLAREAGIEVNWRDVDGNDQTISDESLRAVLAAIGFPAATPNDIRNSIASLHEELEQGNPPLITADLNHPIHVAGRPGRFRITLESGFIVEGMAVHEQDNRLMLPALNEPGYHHLEFNDTVTMLAVAPVRAYTLDEAAQGHKLWGLTVQLYALRRPGDGGIGDFAALEDFAQSAAARGADAIAISPVHALFSANPMRFSPYAPSNRAALNVLHIAEPGPETADDTLIEWPTASAAKLKSLRKAFEDFHNHAALEAFRHKTGERVAHHALFEAIQAKLTPGHEAAKDWRHWPDAYRDPENPAVMRFLEDNAHEVSFHTYLQYRADEGLQAAQRAAINAGMRIGLIADLAVGTDHAGSHSWSRQKQVLHELEIGAPPDAINREGQSWGITAFSPRGLRNSGFSAFI
jgi:4-alpha-glucanotransferase